VTTTTTPEDRPRRHAWRRGQAHDPGVRKARRQAIDRRTGGAGFRATKRDRTPTTERNPR